MLLTDTAKTKETALQKKLIEKRNLFGLGVTSLIAACSGAADGTGGDDTTTTMLPGGDDETPAEKAARKQEERADALPFKAKALTDSGYTAEIETTSLDEFSGGTDDALDVKITKGSEAPVFLNFPTGDKAPENTAYIHKLTPNLGQYDLVISAYKIDKNSGSEEENKGRIFIYWDVAKVAAAPDPKASTHLEIKGAKRGDNIGINAPDFLKIGGTDNKYDMIIRSYAVDKKGNGGRTNEGAIYILWDIVDYDEATKTIDLNPTELGDANNGATSGSLAIYGTKTQLSGAGERTNIGTHAPEFLQIGGKEGNNYDMVIRSQNVDTSATTAGAIYILWDVEDYYQKTGAKIANKRIDLDELGKNNDPNLNATAGSLTILGATGKDNIGSYAPEFLQIGGKEGDNKLDMVIRSDLAEKSGLNTDSNNEGAIYVLWDVEDYYGTQPTNSNNKFINLGADSTQADFYATFGLLTIYGAAKEANLGSNANNILYKTVAGNKTLTDIDGDKKIDIAITDGMYTYVFFGNQIAATTGTDGDTKVLSKSIDLAKIAGITTFTGTGGEGYFEYDFGAGTSFTDITDDLTATPVAAANKANATGYRFAKNDIKTSLDDVRLPTGLSDADADLGVWDIA